MRTRSDWFTIVATDLFAGSFAAILIIDAATPKEPISLGEPVLFQLQYYGGDGDARVECEKTDNVVFAFTDDQGEKIFSTDARLSGQRTGRDCQVIGLLDDVALAEAPDDARILVAFRPEALEAEEPISVKVTISVFELVCTEVALCERTGG